VLFTLADCDPSGRQMSISIARKLQAFRDLFFPWLRFEVACVALSAKQVRDLGLPETPLKESEKRADRWRIAFGIHQTEIDALTTPTNASILRRIIRDAFKPYIDETLRRRVSMAETEWRSAAQKALDEQIDEEHLSDIRIEAETKLQELREQIDAINEQLQLSTGDIDLPSIVVPKPSSQRKSRAELVAQRQREAEMLTGLKTEQAAAAAKAHAVEVEAAPIMYVAQLLGGTTEQAIRWLILAIVLCCDPLAIALTAAASARR
jgi:hypothetical protein